MSEFDWEGLSQKASTVFTPAAPVDEKQLFAGRLEQLNQVIDVINQKGQHAIIFGERGVGKTSLANVIVKGITGPSAVALRKNCDTSDTYSSLWKKIFDDIILQAEVKNIGFIDTTTVKPFRVSDNLGKEITPDDVRKTLTRLSTQFRPIIIIDEFDRITRPTIKSTMADTIKTLSDHAVGSTVIVVGVADSVDQLIKEHYSIERALVQIKMPRMSNGELRTIIDNGLKILGMQIDDDAKRHITLLSQGLPHYIHLLGLNSVRQAISLRTKKIALSHVELAVTKAIQQAQQTTLTSYHKAVTSPRKDNIFSQVLLACALSKTDDLGYFAASDVKIPLSKIMKKPYDVPGFSRHLNDFCDNERGPILHKIGKTRKYRFRFTNPLMQPFVTMQGFASGLINKKLLEELKEEKSSEKKQNTIF